MTRAGCCAPRDSWRHNKGTFHSSLNLPFPVKNVEFVNVGLDERVLFELLLSFSSVSDKFHGTNWSFTKTHVHRNGRGLHLSLLVLLLASALWRRMGFLGHFSRHRVTLHKKDGALDHHQFAQESSLQKELRRCVRV